MAGRCKEVTSVLLVSLMAMKTALLEVRWPLSCGVKNHGELGPHKIVLWKTELKNSNMQCLSSSGF